MRSSIIALLLIITSATYSIAATIKGKVTDGGNGEPAVGAIVSIENTSIGTPVGLDGTYVLKNVPAGSVTVKVSLISFQTITKTVELKDEDNITLPFTMHDAKKILKEVTIVSRNTGSGDAGARQLEKNSDNVMNILSGRTLQLMPDVTVANVLRRISGVTVDRSGGEGEGRYPVIRGMDKRYNYTLINGIKIPSPDDKNRYVPMDIFPSEMLERLEVIKALTPDMEGDAIGGVMNLVMKDAPDRLTVRAQGAVGYAQMVLNDQFTSYDHNVSNQSPAEQHGKDYNAVYADFNKKNLDFQKKTPAPDGQFGLSLGDRFLKHKLGVILTGSWQSLNRNSKQIFFEPSTQPNPTAEGNEPSFGSLQLRDYSIHQSRTGVHTKIDYRFNDKNKISLYGLFMNLNNYQSRYIVDSNLAGRALSGLGGVDLKYRSRTILQDIYNATLQGQHTINDHLYADWSGVYSVATQKTPDQAELTTSETVNLLQHTNTAPMLASVEHIWQHNSDKNLAGYANIHYKFNVSTQKFDIGVGGMYRHKDRDNYYNNYSEFKPGPLGGSTTPFTNIYEAQFHFNNVDDGKGNPASPNVYSATEDISAGYAEARWIPGSKWNILAGVRMEHTAQTYDQTAVANTVAGKTGTSSYSDLLPSLTIKYLLNKKEAIHFSYFKSISRPGFFEIVPYEVPGEDFNEDGNPKLHHTTADNLDLRYELFPGGSDQLLIGAFYKRIQNAIELNYIRTAIGSTPILIPQNQNTASNAGIELVYTKFFNRIGVSANYTYTYSNVRDSPKVYYTANTGGSSTVTTKFIEVNRPLQGQAAHVGNISLLYKNKKGLEAQLAAVYTGRHIVFLSPWEGLNYWQRGTIVLDFSGEKTIGKHFSVYAKIGNLLNTPDYVELMHDSKYLGKEYSLAYQTRDDRILVEKKTYGQTYLVGIRFHL